MALWRIHPVAAPADSRWQGREIWSEIIVRAETAAMARLIAARLDAPDSPSRIGNETLCFRSGIEDDKLYWVRRLADDAVTRIDAAKAGVVRAIRRADSADRPIDT